MPVSWSLFAQNLVLFLCLLPLAGVVLIAAASRWGDSTVRQMAWVSVLLSCGLSVLMVLQMQTRKQPASGLRVQMVSVYRWLATERFATSKPQAQNRATVPSTTHRVRRRVQTLSPDVRLAVGVDGFSVWPIVLTSLLMVPAVLLGEKQEREQPALFYSLLLVFQSAATGLFAALDVVLFCFCFELTILPLCLLIGRWGGPLRRPAARRLFVGHLVGSLFVLLGLMGVVVTYGWMQHDAFGTAASLAGSPLTGSSLTGSSLTFSIPQLLDGNGSVSGLVMLASTHEVAGSDWDQFGPWWFLFLLVGFLVRPALFPFHSKLTAVVREAPPVARVLLLGVVPLFSLYGCVRFLLPLFPAQCAELGGTISTVAIVGLVFTSLLALAETDAVKRIALASVGLFELSLAGIFSRTPLAVTGGLVQMLSVGLAVGLLLLLIGFGDRPGQIGTTAGKPHRGQPRRRALLLFAMLAVMGAPGLSGFSGATLLLLGFFQQSGRLAILAIVGLLLVAWSVGRMWPTGRYFRNGVSLDQQVEDLTLRECAALAPIVVAIVWIGVHPQFFVDRIEPALQRSRPATAFDEAFRSEGSMFPNRGWVAEAEDWMTVGAESYNVGVKRG